MQSARSALQRMVGVGFAAMFAIRRVALRFERALHEALCAGHLARNHWHLTLLR